MKLIRELTFGPPKCWKTGSKVSTYPKPMLVLELDEEGLSVIKEPLVLLDHTKIEDLCKRKLEELAPIEYIDFCHSGSKKMIMETYLPQGDKAPFAAFIKTVNKLTTSGCPWKTIVLDGITGLDEIIKQHNAVVNPGSLGSALKWASLVGEKIKQIIGVLVNLPCHVVILCHASAPEKDEGGTEQVEISVVMTSKRLRNIAGGLVSQFLYQCKEGGKIVTYTTDKGFVKGIGCRWPYDLPAVVGPTFKDIYGKELQ